jgi:hypothetical protein
MKFILTFGAGIAFGYTIHYKKDQTIESLVTGSLGFLEARAATLRNRYTSDH